MTRSSKGFVMRMAAAILCLFLVMAVIPAATNAQDAEPDNKNLFAGFGTKSDEPYEIDADELEVLDAEKIAILTGNVNVRQGTSLLKAPYLKVFYDNAGNQEGGGESQGIRRLEARQGVYVESGTQVATGDEADYDAEAEEMIMTGNVVLVDGCNVIKGDQLYVNLRTGESKVTAPKSNRIKLILKPGGDKPENQAPSGECGKQ